MSSGTGDFVLQPIYGDSGKPSKPKAKPTPTPPPPPQPSIGDRAKQFGLHAAESAVGALSSGLGMAAQAMGAPVEAFNAVAGTPMRMSQATVGHKNLIKPGMIGAGLAGPAPLLQMLDPRQREIAGHQIYAAFHPYDPRIQEGAEQQSGLSRLTSTGDIGKKIPEWVGSLYDPKFDDPQKKARGVALATEAQDFLVHTGGQVAMDPLTYTGRVQGVAGDLALAHYDTAVNRAITGKLGRGGFAKAAQQVARAVTPLRGRITSEGRVLDRTQRAVVQTFVNKHDVARKAGTQADTEFLKSIKRLIPKGTDSFDALKVANPELAKQLLERGIYTPLVAKEEGTFLDRISRALTDQRNRKSVV